MTGVLVITGLALVGIAWMMATLYRKDRAVARSSSGHPARSDDERGASPAPAQAQPARPTGGDVPAFPDGARSSVPTRYFYGGHS